MTYRLVLADTRELIDAAYRVRHHAFVDQARFERLDLAEMETDGHDRRSVHVLVFLNDWPLAAARLILPPDLPIRSYCPQLPLADDAGEVSRFSLTPPTLRSQFDVLAVIQLLGRGIVEAAERHQIKNLYCLIKPALRGLLGRAGFDCTVIGPALEHHGRRLPCEFRGFQAASI